jgi:hypothetical protein
MSIICRLNITLVHHDAVIQGIRRHTNNYDMKYVGLEFARRFFLSNNFLDKILSVLDHNQFAAFRYFLNHSNHVPNIPLDMLSNHFYATSGTRTNPSDWSIY